MLLLDRSGYKTLLSRIQLQPVGQVRDVALHHTRGRFQGEGISTHQADQYRDGECGRDTATLRRYCTGTTTGWADKRCGDPNGQSVQEGSCGESGGSTVRLPLFSRVAWMALFPVRAEEPCICLCLIPPAAPGEPPLWNPRHPIRHVAPVQLYSTS